MQQPKKSTEWTQPPLVRKGDIDKETMLEWFRALQSPDANGHIFNAVILKLSNGAYAAGTKIAPPGTADAVTEALKSALALSKSEFPEETLTVESVHNFHKNLLPGKGYAANEFAGLPPGAITILNESGLTPQTRVQAFNGAGIGISYLLSDAAKLSPTATRETFIEQDITRRNVRLFSQHSR